MRRLLPPVAVGVLLTAGAWAQGGGTRVESPLYAAYLAQGPAALAEAFPTRRQFEDFRQDFRDRVLTAWEAGDRVPAQAMFMYDVSLAAQRRGYLYWADFLLLGQTFLRQRPDPPGADAALDTFELQWNKTIVAFLAGRRQPELVEELVKRLPRRIRPEAAADGTPSLVDPWILMAEAFVEEGYVLEDAGQAATHGARAIELYRAAARYEPNRAEATVRLARLLLLVGQPSEALAAAGGFDEAWTREGVVVYWARLIRGRVLDALDRPDEAMAAYQSALAVARSAQAPSIGMMAVESKRNAAEADRIGQMIRTAADPVIDPWWIYPHGDLRFYRERDDALRRMAGR